MPKHSERIQEYLSALPDATLRRLIDEPEDKWAGNSYVKHNGCRCLVGIAEDHYLYTNDHGDVLAGDPRDAEAIQVGRAYSMRGLGTYNGTVEFAFDTLYGVDNAMSVRWVKQVAQDILNSRAA